MSDKNPTNDDQARFWNEDGGRRWVEHIDQLERMLNELNGTLLAALALKPGEKVLDVGCGGGRTTLACREAVGEAGSVLGVDVSAVILDVARARGAGLGGLDFMTADAASHDFGKGGFDVITSRFGVMFFPDPGAAFANLRSAAGDNARLCFLCWRSLPENPWMGAPAAAAFTVIPAPEKPAPGTPGPFAFADTERVRGILESAGFGDVSFEAVDLTINLGTVDEALEWLTNMGPAATPLAEASPTDRIAAQAAMRELLSAHDSADGVSFPGAVWLVRARAA